MNTMKQLLLRAALALGALTISVPIARAIDLVFTDTNTEESNRVEGINFDGSGLTTLIDSSGANSPNSITYNPNNGRIYFADNFGNAIKSATSAGTDVQTLFSGMRNPVGIALDLTNGHIYFTQEFFSERVIKRANIDGTGTPVTLISGLPSNPAGIALDVAANHMYWLNGTSSPSVERANLDGTNRSVIFSTSGGPKNIGLDIPNQRIYFTNNEGGGSIQGVYRVNFDGSGSTQLITASGYTGIALDLPNSRMFLTNRDDTIQRANLDGTGITTLVSLSGDPNPYGIAIIPEPSTYALMLGALALGLAGYLRFRRKAVSEEN